MENASKALIIAGAIFLAISIIGIGMYVFTQASDAIKGTGLTQEQADTYNAPFLAYEGTQRGSSVRLLCDKIRSHNLDKSDDYSQHIAVQAGSAAGVTAAPTAAVTTKMVNDVKATILQGKTYTVDFGFDANSGLIVAVGITEKK